MQRVSQQGQSVSQQNKTQERQNKSITNDTIKQPSPAQPNHYALPVVLLHQHPHASRPAAGPSTTAAARRTVC